MTQSGSVYAFDGSALNAYDDSGEQQWSVPLALAGAVEITPVGDLLLLLSNRGDLAALQQDGVLCAAGRIYGDGRALLWHSPDDGTSPIDNVLRTALGDQVIGVDWQRFTSACQQP